MNAVIEKPKAKSLPKKAAPAPAKNDLGASLSLFMLWLLGVGVRPGLGFHFLGVTVFTLMFGWSLGVIGVSLIMVGITATTGHWSALAMNTLLLGIVSELALSDEDQGLFRLPSGQPFDRNRTRVAYLKGRILRGYEEALIDALKH